jgi:hypothetical protein
LPPAHTPSIPNGDEDDDEEDENGNGNGERKVLGPPEREISLNVGVQFG